MIYWYDACPLTEWTSELREYTKMQGCLFVTV